MFRPCAVDSTLKRLEQAVIENLNVFEVLVEAVRASYFGY